MDAGTGLLLQVELPSQGPPEVEAPGRGSRLSFLAAPGSPQPPLQRLTATTD